MKEVPVADVPTETNLEDLSMANALLGWQQPKHILRVDAARRLFHVQVLRLDKLPAGLRLRGLPTTHFFVEAE